VEGLALKKKICMLGASAVGKTSLVARYVHSMFSEKYHTTVGVKIDRKTVQASGTEINLMLWDIEGDDDYQSLRMSYLRGTSGYILVADGTRRATLERVRSLRQRAIEAVGQVPCVLVLNKADLVEEWDIDAAECAALEAEGLQVIKTSAKTGVGVEECFLALAGKMVAS
jgi:small GTP-binding protein